MANSEEENRVEEAECESESEESLFGLTMRRREASDDDEDDGEAEARERLIKSNRRFSVGRGDEPDGLGGYDDDYKVSFVNEREEIGDAEVEVKVLEGEEEEVGGKARERKNGEVEATEEGKQRIEKGENELLLDPKFGAFYMHDDRFRGRSRGRRGRRHTLDGRFRETKYEEKWRHDKFEEMNLQETFDKQFIEVRRTPEDYHPGNHKNKSSGGGYITANWSEPHENINNQIYSSRIVKGRGPIKYKPTMRSSIANPSTKNKEPLRSKKSQGQNTDMERVFSTRNKQSGKFVDMTSKTNSVRAFSHISEKKDVQPEISSGDVPTSVVPSNNVPKSNALLHGEIAANPVRRDRLNAEKFIHSVSENYLTSLPFQSSVNWPTYMIESTQMMGQRGLVFPTMLSHPLTPPCNHVNSVYQPAHSVSQQMPLESIIQPPLLVSTQQFRPCCGSESQTSSEAFSPNSYEPETSETQIGSKVAVIREGINSLHRRGGCFVQSAGAQVMKNGSRHNGGNGDPAVNMPVAGYIPQLQSFGNPKMTCHITHPYR